MNRCPLAHSLACCFRSRWYCPHVPSVHINKDQTQCTSICHCPRFTSGGFCEAEVECEYRESRFRAFQRHTLVRSSTPLPRAECGHHCGGGMCVFLWISRLVTVTSRGANARTANSARRPAGPLARCKFSATRGVDARSCSRSRCARRLHFSTFGKPRSSNRRSSDIVGGRAESFARSPTSSSITTGHGESQISLGFPDSS